MDFAFSFIIRNGGLDTEKDYKYKAADGTCNINKEKRHVVTIDSYEDVPPNDESALKKVTCAVIPGTELGKWASLGIPLISRCSKESMILSTSCAAAIQLL